MNNNSLVKWLAPALITALFATPVTQAADALVGATDDTVAVDKGDGVEVTRGATELRDVLSADRDLDSIDTALVFQNPRNQRTLVVCIAYGANGNAVGRAYTVVPGNGLRFIRASDLSNGVDYIGSAKCDSRTRVVPAAFIVGVGFSDTPARVAQSWDNSSIRFPVIASF